MDYWHGRLLVTSLTLAMIPATGAAQIAVPPPIVRPAPPSGWTVEGQEVEGRVTSVDRPARVIGLDNGQTHVVPRALRDRLTLLEPGGSVRLRYGVNGGRNMATAIDPLP